MKWIEVTPINGPTIYINPDHIAYIAEPPVKDMKKGVGAGISFIDNTKEVVAVEELTHEILDMIYDADPIN